MRDKELRRNTNNWVKIGEAADETNQSSKRCEGAQRQEVNRTEEDKNYKTKQTMTELKPRIMTYYLF